MASEYKYDEESETWPYFVAALLVFVLLPLTFSWVYGAFFADRNASASSAVKGAIAEDHNTLQLPNASHIDQFQSRRKKAKVFNAKLAFIVVGWITVVFIWISYAKEVSLQNFFDPHTILDLPYTASEREIKSRYRKLSLQFHPDKIGKDLGAAAKEEMEAAFIRINSAYKALTDEVTKNNLRLYGHPDGQQEITHGIAIPKFLVEGKYSPIMLVVYFLLIGVLLPVVVGSWWNNVKSTTKKGMHVNTATLFVRKLADKNPAKVFTPIDILDWVLQSQEIKNLQGSLSDAELKALVLEHLNREFSSNHEATKLIVVSKLPELIQGFIDIATAFRIPDVILAAYDLQKAVIQATSPVGKHRELLQLPYVNREKIESQDVKKLGKLLTLSKEEAGKVLGIENPKHLDVALNVAKKVPFIRVLDATFRVPGEDIITPNSTAHLVIKFLIKSPALKSCPEIEESRFLEEETIEDLKFPLRSNDDPPYMPYAYAPYFPRKLPNRWEGYIVNQKDNKFVEGAEVALLERVDLSNLELTQKEWEEGKEDTVVLSTFKIKLLVPTPPTACKVFFRLIMKNVAYFGNDVDIPLEMTVTNPPMNMEAVKKATQDADSDEDSDSDISDPEEDTLAGALAALRGQKVKKALAEEEEEESDNESVFTDINTDTEDEADEK